MRNKRKIMPVNTLNDLIFLVNNNNRIFEKRIEKLAHKSRGIKILSLAAIGCVILSEVKWQKQEEQLYQLSVRVKKLEDKEGE